MGRSQPTTEDVIEALVADELVYLHPIHIARFETMRVRPRPVPVTGSVGEYVYVVAEYQGRVLYYSDIEEAWGLAMPDDTGGINLRESGQFRLMHIMNQLFGAPNIRTCGG